MTGSIVRVLSALACLRSAVVPVLTTAAVVAAFPAAGRSLTARDILKMEDVGRAVFLSDGRRAIVEFKGAYNGAERYMRGFLDIHNQGRSQLVVVDPAEPGKRALLLPGYSKQSVMFASHAPLSPDGQQLAVAIVEDLEVTIGVVDPATGAFESLPITPKWMEDDYWVVWAGSDRLAYVDLPPDRHSSRILLEQESAEYLPVIWAQAFKGKEPSAIEIFSRAPQERSSKRSRVRVMHLPDGSVETLGEGTYVQLFPSPDGKALAALRDTGVLGFAADVPLRYQGAARNVLELEIGSVGGGKLAKVSCEKCDVFPGSVTWSPSSLQVAFLARTSRQPWPEDLHLFRGDAVTGEVREVRGPDGAIVHPSGFTASEQLPFMWAGDKLVFRTTGARWFVDAADARVTEQEGLPGANDVVLLGATSDDVTTLIDGEVRKISLEASSSRTILVNARLPPRPAIVTARPPSKRSLFAYLNVGGTRDEQLAAVSVVNDNVSYIQRPAASDFLLATDQRGTAALFVERAPRRTLTFGDRQKKIAVADFNHHLAAVQVGTPKKLSFRLPGGETSYAWLLLPPGAQPGEQRPLVVEVYGDVSISQATPEISNKKVEDRFGLNHHLFAARGFAVLYPSIAMPRFQELKGRDPAETIWEKVEPAVDAAIATGEVSPGNLFLYGHSYGMFTALSVLRKTTRFNAAVVGSGFADLASYYGSIGISQAALLDRRISIPLWNRWGWAEWGQGRMGVPPWSDPQRYVRNSPYFNAHEIHTPVMFFHGDFDVVPVSQSEEMFAAMTRLEREAKLVVYRGEGHNFSSPANIEDLWGRVEGWYREHVR